MSGTGSRAQPAGGVLGDASGPSAERLDLGEVLLRTSRLEPAQLGEARTRQLATGERLADILVEEGMLGSEEVLAGIAEQLAMDGKWKERVPPQLIRFAGIADAVRRIRAQNATVGKMRVLGTEQNAVRFEGAMLATLARKKANGELAFDKEGAEAQLGAH